jgi:hypothetical protein
LAIKYITSDQSLPLAFHIVNISMLALQPEILEKGINLLFLRQRYPPSKLPAHRDFIHQHISSFAPPTW